MGRMSIIIVLGFIIIAGLSFVSIREADMRSINNTVENAYSVERNFSAKDIVSHAIQMHLKKQGLNTSDSAWMNCVASISQTKISSVGSELDTFLFDATSDINGIEKNMTAQVVYNARSIPIIHSPVTIHSSQAGVSLTSISYINGENIGMDDMRGNSIYDKYGITLTKADTTSLKMDMGDDTTKVVGNEKIPSLDQISSAYYEDVSKYIDLYKSIADTTINTGVLPGGQYGTAENPTIVYLNGETVLDGDVAGYGILAMEGSFSTTDTFTLNWKGIVINKPEPDSNNVTIYLADSSAIYGALISGANAMSEVNCLGEVAFDIVDGEVIPGVDYRARIQILGSELSYTDNSGYDHDAETETWAYVGGTEEYYWNDVRFAEQDGWKDVDSEDQQPAEYYIWEDGEGQTHPAGSPVKIKCKFEGRSAITSNENSDNLIVLRNGDNIPGMAGSGGQADVESFLSNYINLDTRTMQLSNNQAVYLFDGNNRSFPSWDQFSGLWQEAGYYYNSTTFIQEDVEKWYWDRRRYEWVSYIDHVDIPTDQNSYEYWNYNTTNKDYFVENVMDFITRDFQDCVVLATLFEPPDEPPVVVIGDTTTNNKPVKIQYSKDAIDLIDQLVVGINAETTIVSIDWWDGDKTEK